MTHAGAYGERTWFDMRFSHIANSDLFLICRGLIKLRSEYNSVHDEDKKKIDKIEMLESEIREMMRLNYTEYRPEGRI